MMVGTISEIWQMLKKHEKAKIAFKNKTISSEFFEEKAKYSEWCTLYSLFQI